MYYTLENLFTRMRIFLHHNSFFYNFREDYDSNNPFFNHTMKKLHLLLMILSPVLAFSQQTVVKKSKTIISTNINWWKFEKDNYSILHPQDWTIDTSGTMGSSFILFAPIENEEDKFKENVNLLVQDLQGKNFTMEQYISLSEKQIKSMINNSSILESKTIKNDSAQYHKILFTGEQGTYKLGFEQHYYLMNGKSYVLTFSYERSKAEQYRRMGELMLSSFRLKE